MIKFSRAWAMPTPDTFKCAPIGDFIKIYLASSRESVDPFARNSRLAKHRNDINPKTAAESHLDAVEFLEWLHGCLFSADLLLLDPPYSPRQFSRCYAEIGKPCKREDTQNARFCKTVRDAGNKLIRPGGIVISCGWNSSGMGRKRGYEIESILMVCHGGAHNDTICIAERKI